MTNIFREVEKLADDLGVDRKRSIGEIAKELKVATHVIRFWEENFPQIKPEIGAGKRRYYYNKQLKVLKRIKKFLYEEGYTVAGLQKLLSRKKHNDDKAEDLDMILGQDAASEIEDVDTLEITWKHQSTAQQKEYLERKIPPSHPIEDFLEPETKAKIGIVIDPKAKIHEFSSIKVSAIDADLQEEIFSCVKRIRKNVNKLKELKIDVKGY